MRSGLITPAGEARDLRPIAKLGRWKSSFITIPLSAHFMHGHRPLGGGRHARRTGRRLGTRAAGVEHGLPYLSFGRLRPLHTNAAIFAFAGNAVFAAVYHSTQRLCKARMFSDFLSWFHFWGWQLIIVAAAVTLPLGLHAVEGICRAGMAHRPGDRRGVGGLCRQLLRHDRPPPRTPHVRGPVVLHRHGRDDHRPARLQQPGTAGRPAEELSGLCRRAGRLHGVVVRPQRGGLLAHHAVPGHDVLLLAQGGRSGRSIPTA